MSKETYLYLQYFVLKERFSEFSFNTKYYAHGHVGKMLLRNRARRGITKYPVGKCASCREMKTARICEAHFCSSIKKLLTCKGFGAMVNYTSNEPSK